MGEEFCLTPDPSPENEVQEHFQERGVEQMTMGRKKTLGRASSKIVQAARELRRKQTPNEKKLWEALRDRRLAGLKFRRQHPYERFVLDAYCAEHQLEVEVDGEYHDDPKQAAYDLERTLVLQERGIRVLRFRNDEIEKNFDDVLKTIVEATKL